MTDLAKVFNKAATMTSLEIAEMVSSEHRSVRRSIERLMESRVIRHSPLVNLERINNLGFKTTISHYEFSGEQGKRDSIIIVAQLSPEFTARLVDRWQELESKNRIQLPDFSNPALAARAWADEVEQKQAALVKLHETTPKALFVDRYVESTGLKGFRQVAKLLNANERQLRDFIIAEKIMYKLAGEWTAYQQHIEAGRFECRTGTNDDSNHTYTRALFTPKGITWLAGIWAQYNLTVELV